LTFVPVAATEIHAVEDLEASTHLVMEMAKQRSLTLATAESCTAGALVHLLAEAPGAGDLLHGGYVVYTKAHKTTALGVPTELLARHTAVSGEAAEAMARGGIKKSRADLVVAITGVAGPDPDEDGNPVGLVYVAVVTRDGRARVVEHRLGSVPKREICQTAMRSALDLLEEFISA
jgi:nicotinamide-nucleotide amidase